MKWNQQTVKTVAIVFATVAFVAFMLKFTSDHDGETITLGGDDPSSSAPVSPGGDDISSGDIDDETGLPWILEEELPALAQGTLALIDQGGPYPYERDGITFENREGILPDESRGYYHEYTVVAPNADDRGPERIVTGDGGEFYWTADHYESFERVLRRSS
jgi:ribonuclease T1